MSNATNQMELGGLTTGLTREQVTKTASDAAVAIIVRLETILDPRDEYGVKKADDDLPDGKELHSLSIALGNAWRAYSDINKLNVLEEKQSPIVWLGM